MADFSYHELFPLAEDTETEYRQLTTDHVGIEKLGGKEILTIESEVSPG